MSDKIRKYVLPNLPYLFVFWFFSKIGTAYRIAPGTDFGTKLMGMLDTFPKAFESYWPGLGGIDLLVGLAGSAGMYLLIQSKIKQAKKFRRDVLVGDYYVPDLKLPEERRPIGHWGRLHQSYLKLHRPMLYNELILSGRLHTVVADLNEQAADRLDLIIRQMMKAEGVTEAMKAENQMLWVQSMNSIRCRAEEIIKTELIYC